MIVWAIIVIQWCHVLLGLFWFGSTLYFDIVLVPAVTTLPLELQRTISQPLAFRADRVFIPSALLVMLLGLLRGTIWGPVKSWEFLFGTPYGLTFLVAFLATIATFVCGVFLTSRAARKLDTFPLAEVKQPGGASALAFAAQVQRVKLFALIELLGFFVVFTCMILMRFGL
jgi:uncharacterized membrane protein